MARKMKKVRKITVGTDITVYHKCNTDCYYVTEVINQKNIKVKKYNVYGNKLRKSKSDEIELKFRYGYWNVVRRFTKKDLRFFDSILTKKEIKKLQNDEEVIHYRRFGDGNVSFGVCEYYDYYKYYDVLIFA